MRTGTPTPEDYARQWTPCLDCDDRAIPLQAGTEVEFTKCKNCECHAPLKTEFEDKNYEI